MFFTFYSLGIVAQEDCQQFKTGKFRNVENGMLKSVIERNDSIQTEQYGKQIIRLKVKWLDDCTYQLTI